MLAEKEEAQQQGVHSGPPSLSRFVIINKSTNLSLIRTALEGRCQTKKRFA